MQAIRRGDEWNQTAALVLARTCLGVRLADTGTDGNQEIAGIPVEVAGATWVGSSTSPLDGVHAAGISIEVVRPTSPGKYQWTWGGLPVPGALDGGTGTAPSFEVLEPLEVPIDSFSQLEIGIGVHPLQA